jgi:hypothetical protein
MFVNVLLIKTVIRKCDGDFRMEFILIAIKGCFFLRCSMSSDFKEKNATSLPEKKEEKQSSIIKIAISVPTENNCFLSQVKK